MKPKISILVPVYGVEKFIERCAISLFEQTFEDIEYVFVNDCTPDNSIKILEDVVSKYPNRKPYVKIFNNENNKGIAANRNLLIEKSSGDFVLFVDSDDYLELDTISLLYSEVIKENADIVIFDYFLEWRNNQKIIKQDWDKINRNMVEKVLSAETGSNVWNKLIRRDLFLENNIRTIENVNYAEDFLIVTKLFWYSKNISKVQEPLYHYMQTNTNSYTQFFSEKNVFDLRKNFEDLELFFSKKGEYDILNKIKIGKSMKKVEIISYAKIQTLKTMDLSFFETKKENQLKLNLYQKQLLQNYNKKNFTNLFILRIGFFLLKKVHNFFLR